MNNTAQNKKKIDRVIKFRAWDNNYMCMYAWGELCISSDNIFVTDGDLNYSPSDVNIVLMQFTGLTDKNGKEIYEGDILSVDDLSGVVVYDTQFAMFNAQIHDGEFLMMAKLDHPRKEVMGNIYENPELLGKESL